MSLAGDLALGMAASRASLAPALAALLTPERAWPLAVLLAAWGGTKRGLESGLPFTVQPGLVFSAFDYMEAQLLPMVREAAASSTLPSRVRLAGLGAQFANLAQQIGVPTLNSLVSSGAFVSLARRILSDYPPPPEVQQAFAPPPAPEPKLAGGRDRIREFDRFDYPRRKPDDDPDFIRRQLRDPALPPDLRMFLEERMNFMGLSPYDSDRDAEVMWRAMLDAPMQEEVRSYFQERLQQLTEPAELEV